MMSAFKYGRLKSCEQQSPSYQFSALDGPSYFTYGVPSNKSAYTYSKLDSSDQTPSSSLRQPTPTTVCGCGDSLVIGDCESQEPPPQGVLLRLVTFIASIFCCAVFVLTLPVSAWLGLKLAQSYERFVVFRLGRLVGARGPGYVIILPCIDKWRKVDLRTKAFSIPPQKAITADGATIEVGADVYFRIKDAALSVSGVQDLNHSVRILCQTSLQKQMSKQSLGVIETDQWTVIDALLSDVNHMSVLWGSEIGRIDLSAIKVHSQPMEPDNVVSCLSSVLFPPGNSNDPVEQLQQFYHVNNPGVHGMTELDAHSRHCQYTASRRQLTSVEDLITVIEPRLNYCLVRDFGCVYKFIITDYMEMSGGIYHLDLKHGEGHAGIGEPPEGDADVTLTFASNLLSDLILNRISPFDAYMEGRLSVSGDLRQAMKLGDLIKSLGIVFAQN